MGTLVLVEEVTEDFLVKNWKLEENGGVMGEEGEVKGERGGWETITTTTKGGGEGGGERGEGESPPAEVARRVREVQCHRDRWTTACTITILHHCSHIQLKSEDNFFSLCVTVSKLFSHQDFSHIVCVCSSMCVLTLLCIISTLGVLPCACALCTAVRIN